MQREGMYGARSGGVTELPCPLQAGHRPSTLMCSPTWELSELSLFKSFYNPVSSPPHVTGEAEVERLGVGAESSHLLILCLVFLMTGTPPPILRLFRGPTLSHLISIDSGMFQRGSL